MAAGRESVLLPFFQGTLGMVEYRRGNLAAAEARLAEVDTSSPFSGVASAMLYPAMIAVRETRLEDARGLLTAAEARLRPFPADMGAPLQAGGDHDDLIAWLAYQEAVAMIQRGTNTTSSPLRAESAPGDSSNTTRYD